MHAPIRVTYRESGAFLAEAARQSPFQPKERTWLWVTAVVAVFLFAFGKVMWEEFRNGASLKVLILSGLFVCVIGVGCFLLFNRLFGTRKTNQSYYEKLYRQQTGKDETTVICEFGEVGFLVTTEGGVATHFPWPSVVNAIERQTGLLIFTGPQLFHWFPRAAFASETDFRAVLAMVTDKVSKFERPRASR